MKEDFRPFANSPPVGWLGSLKFYGRMLLDLQILTVYLDLRTVLPRFTGEVLDVGCGASPYRFLLDARHSVYHGIDIADAAEFGYRNPDVTPFDGEHIPFDDHTFDAFLCTEVLEHVHYYERLVRELYRVLKPGGKGIVTVPWSARVHYAPHDYFRYTPSTLDALFSRFSDKSIRPRGTDYSVIASKIISLFYRNLLPRQPLRWLLIPVWILLTPILLLAVVIGHAGIWLDVGSVDDPLGYTVLLTK